MKKTLAVVYGIWMFICMIAFTVTAPFALILAVITWNIKWFWFFFQVGKMQDKIKKLFIVVILLLFGMNVNAQTSRYNELRESARIADLVFDVYMEHSITGRDKIYVVENGDTLGIVDISELRNEAVIKSNKYVSIRDILEYKQECYYDSVYVTESYWFCESVSRYIMVLKDNPKTPTFEDFLNWIEKKWQKD